MPVLEEASCLEIFKFFFSHFSFLSQISMKDSNFFIAWNFARKIGDRPSRIDPLTRVPRLTAVLPGTGVGH